eukprot:TRINITY_DN5997_c1_g1_i6.p1 TRINITY_DN5997_c1_g1~~TRINITY_DN5997_c1_g1_i6.p1  ORF type:complete len:102 (-),score=10.93 TRINITY_DN5997_c1_g1_i6:625-930(-)
MPVQYGVPQGSCLGPILFSIEINDLPLYVSSPCQLVADDTMLHNKAKHVTLLCTELQKDVNNLATWTYLNHMSLHPKNDKFMLVTTKKKRQHIKHWLIELT